MATPAKTKPFSQTTPPDISLTPGHYLRVKDLARCLSMSANSIWRLTRQGKFPKPIKLSEKVTVFKSDDVLTWLESKKAA